MSMPASPSNETLISLAALRGIRALCRLRGSDPGRPRVAAAVGLPHFLDLHLVRIEGEMAGNLRIAGKGVS